MDCIALDSQDIWIAIPLDTFISQMANCMLSVYIRKGK